MNKISFLIILLSLMGCTKKENILPKETVPEFPVIDSKLPLFISKIDFEDEKNVIHLNNNEINSKLLKTITDFYNTESGVEDTYKKYFRIKDCHFKTIRLQDKAQTVFVIILKYYPSDGLTTKVLFYDNASKQFIGEPLDFKIYALYDFAKGKLVPTNLKELFKIETPEINITDKNNDGENEFEFTRLWHNGTFNAIESTLLEVKKDKIDTIQYNKITIGGLR